MDGRNDIVPGGILEIVGDQVVAPERLKAAQCLNRAFDRPLLREFAMRVLFQMSATDSSTLMDSPAASKLGRHRALFLHEEQERAEKFRPYGLPSAEWLAEACETIRSRVGLQAEAAGV